ncbi:hypothetical protein ACFVR2_22850 [Gottfriedia sp. NPDC057991]|uniref:hypothetical protein n=1 Tax=Gottfriedia sp. NPDC057991 TaxID=3346298 RepID=UPI0036D810D9
MRFKIISFFVLFSLILSTSGIVADAQSKTEISTNIVQPMDPTFPSCNRSWVNDPLGILQWNSQVSPTTYTFQWEFELTPQGVSTIGNPATVTMTKALVTKTSGTTRTLYPLSLYSPHTQAYPYTFHGSITSYSYVGSSTTAKLQSGDVIDLWFDIDGEFSTGHLFNECKVP